MMGFYYNGQLFGAYIFNYSALQIKKSHYTIAKLMVTTHLREWIQLTEVRVIKKKK